ncbi:MAG: response regulator transcription factor [Acidobacteriales bacterium]|nr:response regulator transcription factor [Terriglobales bacterium]
MTTASNAAKVFLLAQNRLLREALSRILDKKGDMTVVGSCALSPIAAEQIITANPDVVVMDSFSASVAHLEFVRDVQRDVIGVRVVMIGMEADEQAFLQSVREGALGYMLKDASALEVVAAVRAVANREAVCPPQLCACLFRYVTKQWSQVPNYSVKLGLGLTNREQQLVLLIGRGLTNKEIATQLQLAEQTVRNHVHRMLRKVGANDRFAVVELCRMQGLAV